MEESWRRYHKFLGFLKFVFTLNSQLPIERLEVSIASPEGEWREPRKCQRLVPSRTIRPDIFFQTASRSCLSAMKRILNFSSWTTESTVERSLKESEPAKGKFIIDHCLLISFLIVNRLRIVQRAKELNVRLTNAQAKSKKESTEWAFWWAKTVLLFTSDLHYRKAMFKTECAHCKGKS